MANKKRNYRPMKNPELVQRGEKKTVDQILTDKSQAKGPNETHVQHIERREISNDNNSKSISNVSPINNGDKWDRGKETLKQYIGRMQFNDKSVNKESNTVDHNKEANKTNPAPNKEAARDSKKGIDHDKD